jgi:hypothetical protein
MSIAAVGSTSVPPMGGQQAQSPRTDTDGDSDKTGAVSNPVQAAPTPGTGEAIDKAA